MSKSAGEADAVLDRFKGLKSNPEVVQKFYDPTLRVSKYQIEPFATATPTSSSIAPPTKVGLRI